MRETISVLGPSRQGDLYTESMCIRPFIRGSAALGKSFGLAVLIPEREKYKTMLNLVQAIEGKLPIQAERRRLCLMMMRLLEEGLLADVAISLSALTPALLVSASRSNDNLARVRCCITETHAGAYHT